MGAAFHRGLVYGRPNTANAFTLLFADAWWFTASGKYFAETLLCALLYLRVFGVPITWKKLTGGFVLAWIGYEVDLWSHILGMSERRAAWLAKWLERTLADNRVLLWGQPGTGPDGIYIRGSSVKRAPPRAALRLPLARWHRRVS